jgi:hypothetical protein
MAHPDYDDHSGWIDCWQCGGEGEIADCWEEYACIDPESGCDLCMKRCDICGGMGGWHDMEADDLSALMPSENVNHG